DFAAQLRESLENLATLLAEGERHTGHRFVLSGCEALRVYLRHPRDLDTAQAIMAASGIPAARIAYLRGDVCRRELDVELEGVFAASWGTGALTRIRVRRRRSASGKLLQGALEELEDAAVLVVPAFRVLVAVPLQRVAGHLPVVLLQLDQALRQPHRVL